MRHLIERVLELSDEEQSKISPNELPPGQGSEEELRALLESLQPRIRVYGAGGAGWDLAPERTGPEICTASGWMEKGALLMYAIETRDKAALIEMYQVWSDHRPHVQPVLQAVMSKTRRAGMPNSFRDHARPQMV